MNKDLCDIPACSNHGRYARYCGHLNGEYKKPAQVKPRSKKLEKIMRKEYRPQVKEMVEAQEECRVKSKVCTGMAQGFQHLVGREGKNLTGKKKIPCCNLCNVFIEKNDAWARANGFKLSKHANYKREK